MLLCRKQADDEADTLWDAALADAAVSSQSPASSVEDTAKDAVSIPKLEEVQHVEAVLVEGMVGQWEEDHAAGLVPEPAFECCERGCLQL